MHEIRKFANNFSLYFKKLSYNSEWLSRRVKTRYFSECTRKLINYTDGFSQNYSHDGTRVGEDSLTIGWQWDWAFASSARFGWWQHRPPLLNYSLGNAIIRHKGLSFASALWKPGDINCRASLPSPVPPSSPPFPPTLPREFSTAPAAHIQHLPPLFCLPDPASPSSTNQSSEYSSYYVFHSHTVLSCVGSRAPLDFAPVSPMQTRRTGGCFQTLARATNATPKDRLKCSRVQEMFFKHAICQVTLNVAKQWYGGSRWRIPRRNVFAHYIASINLFQRCNAIGESIFTGREIYLSNNLQIICLMKRDFYTLINCVDFSILHTSVTS